MTTQKQMFTAYGDLETKYMELIEGRMWTGVIHEGGAFCSHVDDHNIHMFEFGEACMLASMKNTTLSFDY